MQKLRTRLEKKQAEVDRHQTLLRSLYENLADGLLDREEYLNLKKNYTRRREEAEKQAEAIRDQMEQEASNFAGRSGWMERFRRHRNITELDRTIVVSLIERVMIFHDHRVEIVYRWHNEFQWCLDLLAQTQVDLSEEAV